MGSRLKPLVRLSHGMVAYQMKTWQSQYVLRHNRRYLIVFDSETEGGDLTDYPPVFTWVSMAPLPGLN